MSKIYLVIKADVDDRNNIIDLLEFFKNTNCYIDDIDEESCNLVGLSLACPKSEYQLIEKKIKILSTKKIWKKENNNDQN